MNRQEQLIDITDMFRQMSKKWNHEWNKHKLNGISPTHASILSILHTKGPQKPSTLATELSVTTGGITGLSDKLVESGYVVRDRDEEDRRIVYLAITDSGRALLEDVAQVKLELVDRLFAVLNDEEIDSLHLLYRKLTEGLGDSTPS